MGPPKISPADLPNTEDIVFKDSLFFKRTNAKLPTPAQVRVDAAQRKDDCETSLSRPPPVYYRDLNLLVKYGSEITLAEGQCLWLMRHFLARDVPVPEIYGWRKDGDETFLYMELIEGDTLEYRWDSLSQGEKTAICAQLRRMTSAWRGLRQGSWPEFVGQIGGQALRDQIFYDACDYPAGPFPNIEAFHDWFARLSFQHHPEAFSRDIPELSGLSEDDPVAFTHGDLHRRNILISLPGNGPVEVIAIVDWHQSGWYPRHWEFLKAKWTADIDGEWAQMYIPQFLEPASFDYWRAFEWIRISRGC